MISAKVIADSRNEFGDRITTMVVTFPRIILAEFNTHRMFSRNSASSRAIPFEKMLQSVKENPFIPFAWQKDHKGMQGTEYFDFDLTVKNLEKQWLTARDSAMRGARNLAMGDGYEGLTKQICNRLLEPFMWHTVIVTATEWENFFALRCPKYELRRENGEVIYYRSKKDLLEKISFQKPEELGSELDWLKINKGQAEIHMMALAEAMWDAYNESKPQELKAGEWHIPFGDTILIPGLEGKEANTKKAIKIATARCARVSYTVVGEEGKEMTYDQLVNLHDNKLVPAEHWSPFEHCAEAMVSEDFLSENGYGWSGNFRGWHQYRKMFENENKIL